MFTLALRKAIRWSMNSNGPGQHKSLIHIEHRASTVGREDLVDYIPVLTPKHSLPSHWVPVLAPTNLLPRRMCSHRTKVWHKTYPICVTLHFRGRRGATSLRYRNRAEITVLMCELSWAQFCSECNSKSAVVRAVTLLLTTDRHSCSRTFVGTILQLMWF